MGSAWSYPGWKLKEEALMGADRDEKGSNRRRFLGQVGSAAAMGSAVVMGSGAATLTSVPALASPTAAPDIAVAPPFGVSNQRVIAAFNLRVGEATLDALAGPAINVGNGDDARYADKGGTFTKGLPHDSFGRVDLTAYTAFKTALTTGKFSDFQSMDMGGGGRLMNCPQGGLAFNLEGRDSVQFGQPIVPPAPLVAGDQTATELLEHYWASLLRDVPFGDYDSSSLAAMAAAELSGLPTYLGPRDNHGQVTTDLLFRGIFPGATLGPYLSQFFVKPTSFGAQPLSQQMVSYVANVDYMTTFSDWLAVQNGSLPGLNQADPVLRYRRNGRDLAAYTHVDVLYQAYFTALLVLSGIGAPLNPGNPYNGSKTETGFGTFGAPDFAGSVGEVSTKALNAVWYQKWFVHLRPRPETTGGLVHLVKTGQGSKTDVQPSNVILNSTGLQQSYNKYGTWLLSQAYPEGSPMHPAYPTGHGVVGGACITLLKFIFDGDFVLPNPVVPSDDGLSLLPYTGSDAGELTVNGELNKLAHNVTFGHGIHAGIHWRSDSDTSLLLGEAVALSFLAGRARTYNEPFTIRLTKFDGTTATISNES